MVLAIADVYSITEGNYITLSLLLLKFPFCFFFFSFLFFSAWSYYLLHPSWNFVSHVGIDFVAIFLLPCWDLQSWDNMLGLYFWWFYFFHNLIPLSPDLLTPTEKLPPDSRKQVTQAKWPKLVLLIFFCCHDKIADKTIWGRISFDSV